MLNDERRTPMKRAPFKRAAPTTKSHSNQAAALTSQALIAIKTRAPLRASTYAAPTEPAAPIAKSAPVRSEAVRRELEPVWAADTRRKIQAMGLWPKALPLQNSSTGDDFELTRKNRT